VIISRTPHRISFFGGGTDYPAWYLEYGGQVLGAAIDKYCYLSCRVLPPYFETKHRIVYSRIELVNEIDEIQHPSVRETLRYLGVDQGLVVHHDGDIPARSGMGSSSAFTVGLLKALYALRGRLIDRERLYTEAIHIEQSLIRENVGSQDQVWAACGGLNTIEFLQNGEILVKPIVMKGSALRRFESCLMLVFTGLARDASEVAGEQLRKLSGLRAELREMQGLVGDAERILTAERADFTDFGRLLNETWKIKRTLTAQVTNTQIDDCYNAALAAGAVGGKLLGAGGGGFMVFYVEPELQPQVKKALGNYLHIPFRFDFQGSEIIVYQPEIDLDGRE
jgi:D-glycero-alpha-D-manno-heptose-7-phosphate kinase